LTGGEEKRMKRSAKTSWRKIEKLLQGWEKEVNKKNSDEGWGGRSCRQNGEKKNTD